MCILDSVENTEHNYKRLLKKLRKNLAYVFQLPAIKLVTEEIESNNQDGEPMYQNQKVQFYSREKSFMKDHIVVFKSVVVIFSQISRKPPSASPQMMVTVLFLMYVIYHICISY